MASDIENLRRIQNLEALVQKLTTKLDNLSVTVAQLQTTANSLVSMVNGMTKP